MSARTRSARYLGPARPAAQPLPDKVCSAEEAVAQIQDGDTVLVGGSGRPSYPAALIAALLDSPAGDLTIICLDADDDWVARLLASGRCSRLLTGAAGPKIRAAAGESGVEIVPPGVLLERLRAAGAGLGGVLVPPELAGGGDFSPTMVGEREFSVAPALIGNVALVKAWRGDRFGNLAYRGSRAGSNPVMATAAPVVVALVDELYEIGDIDPAAVATPGVIVRHVVKDD
ncbi:MAG: CoA transferase subunit A [Chloroflexi bacterium]|nr:CoA transferase subunit A [Chloroflexota bacterium]